MWRDTIILVVAIAMMVAMCGDLIWETIKLNENDFNSEGDE